jgi:glycosyltransferase involved in cell wall biosynthesis
MRIAFHVPCGKYLELRPGGEKETSGDGMIIANLLEALRKRGHQMQIVSQLDSRNFGLGRLPAWHLVAEAARIRRKMKRFSPDAWLVYHPRVHTPDLFGWWMDPKRYVILKGGSEGDRWRLGKMPKLWRKAFSYAYRKSLKRADMIEAVSPRSVRDLQSLGVPEEKIRFLPRAIKPWSLLPCRQEARRVLGLPQEAPIVLCVSRLQLRRGEDDPLPSKTECVLDLMRALQALPSKVLLLVVGDGLGRPKVEEEARRLKLDGRVRLAGRVEHNDVGWYHAACDFFAFPERHESNRAYQSSLEAQACGRPVVLMHNDLSEVTTEPGRTGLLARDLDEFQTHLLALAQDRDRCDEMGRAGEAFIARSFTIDVRARQIEELLFGERGVSAVEAEQQPSVVQSRQPEVLPQERLGT